MNKESRFLGEEELWFSLELKFTKSGQNCDNEVKNEEKLRCYPRNFWIALKLSST